MILCLSIQQLQDVYVLLFVVVNIALRLIVSKGYLVQEIAHIHHDSALFMCKNCILQKVLVGRGAFEHFHYPFQVELVLEFIIV